MVLADEETPYKTKLAIIVNAVTCEPCECENVEECELKKELEEMDYKPIGKGSKSCKYCISQRR